MDVSLVVDERNLQVLLLDRISNTIGTLTRFDRSSLVIEGCASQQVRFSATQTFHVLFFEKVVEGDGRLWSEAIRVENRAQLRLHTELSLNRCRTALPRFLERWNDGSKGSPAVAPSARDCYERPPSAGFDYGCEACSGRGKIPCRTCEGKGLCKCWNCKGRGRTTCGLCHGQKKQPCRGCWGTGFYSHLETFSERDPYSNIWVTGCRTVKHPCFGCHGDGQIPCSCDYCGEVECSPCGGKGKLTCKSCNGDGSHRCDPCAGSGWRNTTASVQCTVTEAVTSRFDSTDAEIVETLRALPGIDGLCRRAHSVESSARIGADSIVRDFLGFVQVTIARPRVNGLTLSIYGFGAQAEVFDLKRIVEFLLRDDLGKLQRATSKRCLRSSEKREVISALQRSFESPVNFAIVDWISQGRRLDSGRNRQSGVSDEYATATGEVIRAALFKTSRVSNLLLWMFVVLLSGLLQAVGAIVPGYSASHLLMSLAALVVSIVVVCVINARRLPRCFLPAYRGGVARLLSRFAPGRLHAVGSGALGLLLSILLFTHLPHRSLPPPPPRQKSSREGAASAAPAATSPPERCSIEALSCGSFQRKMSEKELASSVVRERKSGNHVRSICLAEVVARSDAAAPGLRGQMWAEAAASWDALGCPLPAGRALEAAISYPVRGGARWRETCALCRKLGKVDCRVCQERKKQAVRPAHIETPTATDVNSSPLSVE